jgi:hypothetical protein
MSTLAGLQRAFAAALHDGAGGAIAERVRAAGAPVEARIAQYRRNMDATRHNALAAAYPVVRRLVGEAFFAAMARRYGAEHPSRSGDLHVFGDAFDRFIAAYAPARGLAYLADVARLEWACHECFHAADARFDASALARVPASRRHEVRLRLHPAVRLLESPHPIVAIWEANQPGNDATPARAGGPDRALVRRDGVEVRVRCLERAEWTLLRSLGLGATLEEAVEAMGAAEAQRALSAALARFGTEGLIAGFELAASRA